MGKSLYKYVGPKNFGKIFSSPEKITVKCSQPKDFNDPYELFLTVDFNQRPDVIAFYEEVIGELPQRATTCFSLSPSVLPMWAHYSQNSEGFAIEFDEEKLAEAFPESSIADVDYRDEPQEALTDMLFRASEIGKGRYVFLLQSWVFKSAYFTKTTPWAYEQERRMVLGEAEVQSVGDLLLADVPANCVKSLIFGARSSAELTSLLRDKAAELGCNFYEMKIGKSSALPYFIDSTGSSLEFNGTDFQNCSRSCASCSEPLRKDLKLCAWCQINESHLEAAAQRNPYRIFDRYGLLDSYLDSMNRITENFQKK